MALSFLSEQKADKYFYANILDENKIKLQKTFNYFLNHQVLIETRNNFK